MDTKTTCQHCGKLLGPEAIEGLCPDCLMKMGLGIGTETSGAAPQGKRVFTPPTTTDLASKFPQFEILALIGQGGMGAVYKARQRQLDRLVALKILPPGIGEDPAFADRFAREARAMAKLNHPGIVTIHDFGCADGLYYLTMEFVDGVSLRQLMHAGRVSPREALAIVPQICDALQYAHDQGIVHRDIKPENILLDRRGRVKVADFGLAKLIGAENEPIVGGVATISSSMTEVGKVMGTPHYMAPEQVGDPSAVDHRADIYALGVVFYQMLTGELPSKPIAPPSRKVRIDVRLDDVVLRALENEPERRYQQVSQVKTAVETITQSSTPDTPRNESRSRWNAIPRWAFTTIYNIRGRVLAGILTLLVIWFLFMLVRSRQSRIEAEMEHARAAEMAARVTPIQLFEAVAREGDIGVYIDSLGSVESSNSVSFTIPEEAVQEVVKELNRGESLSVEAYDRSRTNRFGHGALTAVDNQIDTATGTLKCNANLTPDDENLMVRGLFLNIRLKLGVKHGVAVIPAEAIFRENKRAYVWVIDSDETVRRRRVEVGTAEASMAEIQSGLSPGEVVVYGGKDASAIHEGQKLAFNLHQTAQPADYKFYYVGGGVALPARMHFRPGLTAAIKACGGLMAGAIKEKAELTREGSNAPLVINLTAIEQGKAPDPEIMPGDQLLVPAAPRNAH